MKYSENAFGDTESDERHKIKYDNVYKAKLDKIISSFNADEFEKSFYEEYQLWRNLCGLCNEDRIVCFAFHKYRNDLIEKIESAKEKCKKELQKRIKIVIIDDFIEEILKTGTEKQKNYYSEFKEKYLDLKT